LEELIQTLHAKASGHELKAVGCLTTSLVFEQLGGKQREQIRNHRLLTKIREEAAEASINSCPVSRESRNSYETAKTKSYKRKRSFWIASRMVIRCNALKKDGKYGEGQNRTAEREFSPFAAPGVTCDFFLLIIVKEIVKSRVHYPAFGAKKGQPWE